MSFSRASIKAPCPICKKPDWCTLGDFGAVCMRVESSKPVKNGGWFHPLDAKPQEPRPTLPPPPTINATKLHREWLAETSQDSITALATSLGLSSPSLTAVGAAYAAQHSAWAFPMCDGFGNITGIRLRRDDGAKFAVRGSRQGIFIAHTLPQPTLFVCEGPTDTAAAVEIGLFAVGRPNCCCGGSEIKTFARRNSCRRAVIIADNDRPGLDGARKVGAELKMPFAVYVPPAKDIREFVRFGGTKTMIENTLKSIVWNQ